MMTVDLIRGSFRLPLLLTLIFAPCATALAGPLDEYVLFGVNGGTADLVRFDFAQNQYTTVGTIRSSSGQVFSGIEGMACVPRNLNLFGFWTDPADNFTKVLYINCLDATATVVGQDLGSGSVTAASVAYCDERQGGPSNTSFGPADPTPLSVVREKRLFAVQAVASNAAIAVGGSININPSNSPNNEFTLTKTDGSTVTRDGLHQNSPVDANGAYYSGSALSVFVRPKGNGNQNGLTVNGQSYSLSNGETYLISATQMDVVLYNDKIHKPGWPE